MKKRLFAHLCTWFSTPQKTGRWEMWNSDYEKSRHDPDKLRTDGKRDIAAFGYPLIGPYDSADEDAIRWQLSLMREIGVDGVIVDWDGRRINPHRHEKLLALLRVIREFPLKVIVCFEEWAGYYPLGTFKDLSEGAEAAIAELAWLRENVIDAGLYECRGGKYPVPVFRKMPGHMFGRAEWDKIRAHPAAKDMQFYFENCYDDDLKEVADGWFFWVGGFDKNNFNDLDYFRAALDSYEARVAKIGGKEIIRSVVPGFDDTCVWGWGDGQRIAPRYDGKRYDFCWERVLQGDCGLVQIVTWNDWNEGSHIEPSESFGYEYLLKTAQYAAKWKGCELRATQQSLQQITEEYFRKKQQ